LIACGFAFTLRNSAPDAASRQAQATDCPERLDVENDSSHIVDALPGLVCTALPDGQVDFLNRQWCEFTGSDQREQWQTAIHPDDLPDPTRTRALLG
jgi:hypothetical protein